jgi:hypothetical protein
VHWWCWAIKFHVGNAASWISRNIYDKKREHCIGISQMLAQHLCLDRISPAGMQSTRTNVVRPYFVCTEELGRISLLLSISLHTHTYVHMRWTDMRLKRKRKWHFRCIGWYLLFVPLQHFRIKHWHASSWGIGTFIHTLFVSIPPNTNRQIFIWYLDLFPSLFMYPWTVSDKMRGCECERLYVVKEHRRLGKANAVAREMEMWRSLT